MGLSENVSGHIKLGLDEVLASLETEGYTVWTFIIPACAVNAPHKETGSGLWPPTAKGNEMEKSQRDNGGLLEDASQRDAGGTRASASHKSLGTGRQSQLSEKLDVGNADDGSLAARSTSRNWRQVITGDAPDPAIHENKWTEDDADVAHTQGGGKWDVGKDIRPSGGKINTPIDPSGPGGLIDPKTGRRAYASASGLKGMSGKGRQARENRRTPF